MGRGVGSAFTMHGGMGDSGEWWRLTHPAGPTLDPRPAEAIAAVPNELVDAVHLVGSADKIRDRLKAWKEAGERREVAALQVGAGQPEALQLLAEELL